MEHIKQDAEIWQAIQLEIDRQDKMVNLIASENYVSQAVLHAQGSILTNKYAEGYPGRRYYGGCEFVDAIEVLANERARRLYKSEDSNVQPHSGSQANMAAYFTFLDPGDTVMAMRLDHGGHLTHGSAVNFSGKLYNFVHYGVDRKSELIDYEDVRKLAIKHRPKLIVAGATAYTRLIDFQRFRQIADEIDAKLMVDMAHNSGLIAAEEHPSPVPYSDIVTSSTHKTLRGPRGGFILSKSKHSRQINRAVFPEMQGGPLQHVIAAKAIAFAEAMTTAFKRYQRQVRMNATSLADSLKKGGLRLVSGGTDNHIVLVDLTQSKITGRQAEEALLKGGVVVNRNVIPYDPNPASIASGIRLGTAAITTRGFGPTDVETLAILILNILSNVDDEKVARYVNEQILEMTGRFPTKTISN